MMTYPKLDHCSSTRRALYRQSLAISPLLAISANGQLPADPSAVQTGSKIIDYYSQIYQAFTMSELFMQDNENDLAVFGHMNTIDAFPPGGAHMSKNVNKTGGVKVA